MNNVIDCKMIRDNLKNEYIDKISLLDKKLKLVVISVGNDPASMVYVKNKGRLCDEVGIDFKHLKYDKISTSELISVIDKLNNDDSVTGILVQLPLPSYIDEKIVIESISPLKDVDGLTSVNIGKLFAGDRCLTACTALGVMELLHSLPIEISGSNVVIVGRSKLVGLPLMRLLMNENATVTMCHSKTKNLSDITSSADILIVAIGKKEFIKSSYVKNGATVIDVGINRGDHKLCGDCDFDDIAPKCKYITPVPGGVGVMTVIMLINNIILANELKK